MDYNLANADHHNTVRPKKWPTKLGKKLNKMDYHLANADHHCTVKPSIISSQQCEAKKWKKKTREKSPA